MAIATLDKLYGNADVFTGVVKIRKGLSCKLILHTNSMDELHEIFYIFARSVKEKAMRVRKKGVQDPNYSRTLCVCDKILELTRNEVASRSRSQMIKYAAVGGCLGAAVLAKRTSSVGSNWQSLVQLALLAAGSVLYWQGPWNNSKSELLAAKDIDTGVTSS